MKIFAVIPCFNVGKRVFALIKYTLNYVDKIIIIDDCCPLKTGRLVKTKFKKNNKIIVLNNKKNIGVGGAVKKGYRFAINKKSDYVVKLDGDDQMDPKYITKFKKQIVKLKVDYLKGNRFFISKNLLKMSLLRFIGNIGLSILGKFSTGYWHIFDFTNGYTMIKTDTLRKIDLKKVKNNYFFETDLLYHLNLVNAKVHDIYIPAKYSSIKSNLKIYKTFHYFFYYNIENFFKRIYNNSFT